jgi:methionyl-tRNA formyltransferase
MRVVYFGTPAIAVPALRALVEVAEVVGVVTQPDRPRGRGLTLTASPVKIEALARKLDVTQPLKVRDGALEAWLVEKKPDVLVVLAYGRILPGDVLRVPRTFALNLHASLLPRLRGAAPIEWAILRGDTETGISLMQMDEGLDTGAVLSRHSIEILPEETGGELRARMAELAAHVIRVDLRRAVEGELRAESQDESLATLAPPLRREHGRIDFSSAATVIANQVRALAPKPGAHTTVGDKTLLIGSVRPSPESVGGAPGTVHVAGGRPWVTAGTGSLEILRATPEGRREASGPDLVNGRVLSSGSVLGETSRESGA